MRLQQRNGAVENPPGEVSRSSRNHHVVDERIVDTFLVSGKFKTVRELFVYIIINSIQSSSFLKIVYLPCAANRFWSFE